MNEQTRIPLGKVQRAGKFISTGAKVGANYLKHYGKKMVNKDVSVAELHEDNANDIYNSLSQLKGSALKVAQMLSMDQSVLPTAYQKQFAMAQYSAPPLSFPLVVRTFQRSFNKGPNEIFESFSTSATNAASIGQVHKARLNDRDLAVKVQYPGVARSIESDLAMVKPIALRMFNLKAADFDEYIDEVKSRLLEEVDYNLELDRSISLSELCSHIPNLVFPKYYPDLSSEKILTMDWVEGQPLGEVLKQKSLTAEEANRLGQAMWDFYHFQIHTLRTLHADPHPGNFIVTTDRMLGIIDFGCVKVIPDEFYDTYFQLLDNGVLEDNDRLDLLFNQLNFIYPDDTPSEQRFFRNIFIEMLDLLGKPFQNENFDFSDKAYFKQVYDLTTKLSNMPEIRNSNKVRGAKDALYINRTYFGLYSLLHEMGASVETNTFMQEVSVVV